MNIDNIITFLQKFGITMKIDDNGKVIFIDDLLQQQMDAACTKNSFHLISVRNDPDIDFDVTIDKMVADTEVRVSSPNHLLVFKLTNPRIDKKITSDLIIGIFEYGKMDNGSVKETYSLDYRAMGRFNQVSITKMTLEDTYEMTMTSDGYLEFERNSDFGFYNLDGDNMFGEGFDLKSSDMIDIMNQIGEEAADYYYPIFPGMKDAIEQAKILKTL